MCVRFIFKQTFAVQGVIIVFEVFILLASIAATNLHVRASRQSTDLRVRVSDVTFFHITHAGFCAIYVGYHVYLMTSSHLCLCDPFNIFECLYIGLFACTWDTFLRYFGKATKKIGAKDERWQLRSGLYFGSFLVYSGLWSRGLAKRPCDANNFFLAFGQEIGYVCLPILLCVFLDSTRLAIACFRRLSERTKGNGICSKDFFANLAPFVALPASIATGVVIPLFSSKNQVFTFFLYPIPSLFMLFLMWRRRYLTLNERARNDLEIDWFASRSYNSQSFSDAWTPTLSDDLETALLVLNGEDWTPVPFEKSATESDLEKQVLSELACVERLSSSIDLAVVMSSKESFAEVGALNIAKSIPSTNLLRISEELFPPDSMLKVTGLFLSRIIVPQMERAYAIHLESVAAFMEALELTDGDVRASFVSKLEIRRQQQDLHQRCEELNDVFRDFVVALRAESAVLSRHAEKQPEGGKGFLKKSLLKTSSALAHVPLNLNVHLSSLEINKEGSELRKVISTITFGAPCAHSLLLGWGQAGGLRSTFAKLDKEIAQSTEAHKRSNPEAFFLQLQLRFEARAREGIVLSQALNALVAACQEWLVRCVEGRLGAALLQVSQIGMLLHSVCLLSTSGKEEIMLDDFAGAFERLKVTLRLEEDTSKVSESTSMFTLTSIQNSDDEGSLGNRRAELVSLQSSGAESAGRLVVVLAVKKEVFAWISTQLSQTFKTQGCYDIRVVPVLFNLGVNEVQSVANTTGHTDIQTELNRKGVSCLKEYLKSMLRLIEVSVHHVGLEEDPEVVVWRKGVAPLLDELEALVETEAKLKGKHVDLLLISCFIARIMNGARTTSCKSAKDRSSMFQTLEVSRLAEEWGWLDSGAHEQALLDELRGWAGCRLRNCDLNIGRAAYSFNRLQLQALPTELRPAPVNCAGGNA